MLPPDSAPGPDHGARRGPVGWTGPLTGVFAILATVFALLFTRTPHVLLALGALACLAIVTVLVQWRAKNRPHR